MLKHQVNKKEVKHATIFLAKNNERENNGLRLFDCRKP